MGRNKKTKFNDDQIKMIEHLSGIRLPMEHLATILGISKDTLEKMIKTDDKVRSAILGGRAKASSNVRKTCYQMAIGRRAERDPITGEMIPAQAPDFQALKWWTATQEGFKQADRLEITGADGKPIEMAQMSSEERIAAIANLNKKLKFSDDE